MKEKRNLLAGAGLIGALALWTVLIRWVDVQAVGQNGTKFGALHAVPVSRFIFGQGKESR